MNKSELIEAVAKKSKLKKKDAEIAVSSVIGAIETALTKGQKVQLVGFGTFEVKKRAKRKGINPATKKAITIPASKYPAFKPGKAFKAKVNK